MKKLKMKKMNQIVNFLLPLFKILVMKIGLIELILTTKNDITKCKYKILI